MKIAFTTGGFHRSGGTERVGTLIANALADKGYDVTIMSFARVQKPFYALDKRVRHKAILPYFFWRLRRFEKLALWAAHRHYCREQFDVVIDIDDISSYFTLKALKGLQTKHVAWDHFNYLEVEKDPERQRAVDMVINYSNALVLLTQKDVELYNQHYTIKKGLIHQIYNPISFDSVRFLKHSSKVVIAAGHLNEAKGFDVLLRIWALVEQKVSGWQLFIYGDGALEDALKSEATFLNLRNVCFKGRTNDMLNAYKNAAIYALSSRHEGFPMVLLEAMAMSLPMVAFNCPTGPSEMVEDGKNGFLIPAFDEKQFAEKLIVLMQNEELRYSMSVASYQTSQKYLLDNIVTQWDQLLQSMIK